MNRIKISWINKLALILLLLLTFIPNFLQAGSKKIEKPSFKKYMVKQDPDLIPIRIKLKLTPNKAIYNIGDTLKMDLTISLDKSDSAYNREFRYSIANDVSELNETGENSVGKLHRLH